MSNSQLGVVVAALGPVEVLVAPCPSGVWPAQLMLYFLPLFSDAPPNGTGGEFLGKCLPPTIRIRANVANSTN